MTDQQWQREHGRNEDGRQKGIVEKIENGKTGAYDQDKVPKRKEDQLHPINPRLPAAPFPTLEDVFCRFPQRNAG